MTILRTERVFPPGTPVIQSTKIAFAKSVMTTGTNGKAIGATRVILLIINVIIVQTSEKTFIDTKLSALSPPELAPSTINGS